MEDQIKRIAHGGQAVWEETFEHPEHGPLTFRVERMPRAIDWLQHAVAQERIAPGLDGLPGVLAAAIAGIGTIIPSPVVAEEREEDEDDPSHVKIRRVFYDPAQDEDVTFPMKVWTAFYAWREQLLEQREALGKSSRATRGSSSVDESPAATDSPSTIPA